VLGGSPASRRRRRTLGHAVKVPFARARMFAGAD
jgi:hypothetical protein